MDNKPLISILMNCYNGEEFLKESLNSVISQSYKKWELIFWDNQSTDRSIEIASSFKDERIRIFRSQKHTNLGKARKDAFNNAIGDYLAFLDVDDIWKSNKLIFQIKEFSNKGIGISFTNSIYFSKKNKEILYKNKSFFNIDTKSLITNYPLCLNSIILDIKKLKTLDYIFDERYSNIADFDLIIRLSTISKIKYLDKVLSGWRIHGKNQSFKRKNLFNKEKEIWCNYHLENNYLENYSFQIKELKALIDAEKRILSNKFYLSNFKISEIRLSSNFKNRFFILISYIPIIPKILFMIKENLFKAKWY